MKTKLAHLKNCAAGLRSDETGAISALNLYFIIGTAIMGGIGIDTANLLAARTQLQVAADVAAHAAMYSRATMDADAAKAEALKIAQVNMPTGRYGDVLRTEHIQFGSYDQATKTFTEDGTSTSAVYVETDRLSENANPVSSFLLYFVGYTDFDVRTNAVFVADDVPCLNGGFFAKGRIDMQSNNEFWNGFCLHSDSRIEFNQNNFFEHDNDVIVSAPTRSDLITPGGSWGNNTGLEQAWSPSGKSSKVNVDALIDEIIVGVQTPGSDHYRSFITDPTVLSWPPAGGSSGGSGGKKGGKKGGGGSSGAFEPSALTPGRIYDVSCSGGSLNVGAGTYTDVVIITDCNLNMANGVVFENSTVISTSTDSKGVLKSPQGFTIGKDDNCAPGGGAQIILKGSMKTAAKMKLYGGQIISAGDVKFAAQGNGFGGASVIAGGEIDGTSNSVMGLCEGGKEGFFDFEEKMPPRLAG